MAAFMMLLIVNRAQCADRSDDKSFDRSSDRSSDRRDGSREERVFDSSGDKIEERNFDGSGEGSNESDHSRIFWDDLFDDDKGPTKRSPTDP